MEKKLGKDQTAKKKQGRKNKKLNKALVTRSNITGNRKVIDSDGNIGTIKHYDEELHNVFYLLLSVVLSLKNIKMNKEKLNEIMNCECLQSIIENDKKKHTVNVERFGKKIIQTPNDCSEIIFECFTSYRDKYIDSGNYVIKDRTEKDYCGVPFLYCPICGTKSKHNIPEDSYYHQF